MADLVGQQFNSYRLTRLIGHGGFAEVYLGEHIYLGTPAAVKVLDAELAAEEVKRFRDEARTIANLRHPNIVRLLDFGVMEATPFLILEYAPNGTLRQRHPRGSRLDLPTINGYVKEIASALQYIHNQHLIHRDLKPENLLLGPNNEVLLSDFGIALMAQATGKLNPEQLSGTVPYMAPEQLLQTNVHPAIDQYALGVMVYEWLGGDWPFTGSTREIATKQVMAPPPPLASRVPGLSPRVEEVVMTALAKDPRERFASVQAFATALEQASQAGSSISGGPVAFTPASGKPSAAYSTYSTRESLSTREAAAPVVTPPSSQPLADLAFSRHPPNPAAMTPSSPPGTLSSGAMSTPSSPPAMMPSNPPGTLRSGPVVTPPAPPGASRKRPIGFLILVSILLAVVVLGGVLTALGASGAGPLAFLHNTPATSTPGPSPTATLSVPPGFQLYVNPDHTFRMFYPKGWQQSIPSGGGVGVQFQGPGSQVLLAVNKGQNSSLDPTTDDNSFCIGFLDFSNPPSPTRLVTINDHQWTQKDCNNSEGAHAIVEAIVYKGITYMLAYASSNTTFNANRQMFFTTAEQSFTFLI